MELEKKVFISVIIPTYHDWSRLDLCLKSLDEQIYPKENFEIVVVNNDPDDQVPEYINLPSNCKMVFESKPGSYAARNTGAANAEGEVFSFTDADCKPKKDWLSKINEHFCSFDNPLSGAVEMFSVNNKKKLNLPESYDYIYGINQDIYMEKGVAATANLSVLKKHFDLVNGFDESCFSGGDVDFCRKLRDEGIILLYRSDIIVRHPLRDSFSGLLTKARRLTAGKVRRSFFFGLVTVLSPPIFRLNILFFKKKARIDVKFKALVMLFVIKIYQILYLLLMLFGKKDERE